MKPPQVSLNATPIDQTFNVGQVVQPAADWQSAIRAKLGLPPPRLRVENRPASPVTATPSPVPPTAGFSSDGRYNRRMRRLLLLLTACALVFAQKKPFDVYALLELKRIDDPRISPDGKLVAFTVQTVDVPANKKPVQIWIVPLEGGSPRQITRDGESNQRPRWSPDSRRIAYLSDRAGS